MNFKDKILSVITKHTLENTGKGHFTHFHILATYVTKVAEDTLASSILNKFTR